ACLVFLGGAWQAGRRFWTGVSLTGVAAAGFALWFQQVPEFLSDSAARAALFAGPIWIDKLALFVKALALVGGAVLLLASCDDLDDAHAADYQACILVL